MTAGSSISLLLAVGRVVRRSAESNRPTLWGGVSSPLALRPCSSPFALHPSPFAPPIAGKTPFTPTKRLFSLQLQLCISPTAVLTVISHDVQRQFWQRSATFLLFCHFCLGQFLDKFQRPYETVVFRWKLTFCQVNNDRLCDKGSHACKKDVCAIKSSMNEGDAIERNSFF